jgi:hypothetical protein
MKIVYKHTYANVACVLMYCALLFNYNSALTIFIFLHSILQINILSKIFTLKWWNFNQLHTNYYSKTEFDEVLKWDECFPFFYYIHCTKLVSGKLHMYENDNLLTEESGCLASEWTVRIAGTCFVSCHIATVLPHPHWSCSEVSLPHKWTITRIMQVPHL